AGPEGMLEQFRKMDIVNYIGVEDFADELSYKWTSCLLTVLCSLVTMKTYFLEPVACFVPTPIGFTVENQLEYVNSYCWTEGTYAVHPVNFSLYADLHDGGVSAYAGDKIVYYQWVPIVLAVQAVLFYPAQAALERPARTLVTWSALSGTLPGGERHEKMVNHASRMLHQMMRKNCAKSLRGPDTMRNAFAKAWRALSVAMPAKASGSWLILSYLLIKIVYLTNVLSQLGLMRKFLGIESKRYDFLGAQLLWDISHGRDWQVSKIFPRIGCCAVLVKSAVGANWQFAQCILPVNMINEKIYIFLWFWFVFVSPGDLAVQSLPHCSCGNHFVNRMLKLSDNYQETKKNEYVQAFCRTFLRQDGTFVLKMIALNCGDIVCSEIVHRLWTLYRDSKGLDHSQQDLSGVLKLHSCEPRDQGVEWSLRCRRATIADPSSASSSSADESAGERGGCDVFQESHRAAASAAGRGRSPETKTRWLRLGHGQAGRIGKGRPSQLRLPVSAAATAAAALEQQHPHAGLASLTKATPRRQSTAMPNGASMTGGAQSGGDRSRPLAGQTRWTDLAAQSQARSRLCCRCCRWLGSSAAVPQLPTLPLPTALVTARPPSKVLLPGPRDSLACSARSCRGRQRGGQTQSAAGSSSQTVCRECRPARRIESWLRLTQPQRRQRRLQQEAAKSDRGWPAQVGNADAFGRQADVQQLPTVVAVQAGDAQLKVNAAAGVQPQPQAAVKRHGCHVVEALVGVKRHEEHLPWKRRRAAFHQPLPVGGGAEPGGVAADGQPDWRGLEALQAARELRIATGIPSRPLPAALQQAGSSASRWRRHRPRGGGGGAFGDIRTGFSVRVRQQRINRIRKFEHLGEVSGGVGGCQVALKCAALAGDLDGARDSTSASCCAFTGAVSRSCQLSRALCSSSKTSVSCCSSVASRSCLGRTASAEAMAATARSSTEALSWRTLAMSGARCRWQSSSLLYGPRPTDAAWHSFTEHWTGVAGCSASADSLLSESLLPGHSGVLQLPRDSRSRLPSLLMRADGVEVLLLLLLPEPRRPVPEVMVHHPHGWLRLTWTRTRRTRRRRPADGQEAAPLGQQDGGGGRPLLGEHRDVRFQQSAPHQEAARRGGGGGGINGELVGAASHCSTSPSASSSPSRASAPTGWWLVETSAESANRTLLRCCRPGVLRMLRLRSGGAAGSASLVAMPTGCCLTSPISAGCGSNAATALATDSGTVVYTGDGFEFEPVGSLASAAAAVSMELLRSRAASSGASSGASAEASSATVDTAGTELSGWTTDPIIATVNRCTVAKQAASLATAGFVHFFRSIFLGKTDRFDSSRRGGVHPPLLLLFSIVAPGAGNIRQAAHPLLLPLQALSGFQQPLTAQSEGGLAPFQLVLFGVRRLSQALQLPSL
uniref:Innexin n=1 Tax=Macrostomum lignano TaxID=282301 RepID=A0A1I8HMH0_9PLAT